MKLEQLSVFLENKPGRLRGLTTLLSEKDINIITLSLADTEKFRILRLIVRDYERAEKTLTQKGFITKLTEIVAVEVEDQPGGLNDILSIEEKAGVNVELYQRAEQ